MIGSLFIDADGKQSQAVMQIDIIAAVPHDFQNGDQFRQAPAFQ